MLKMLDLDILHCPFCGQASDALMKGDPTAGNGEIIIYCIACNVEMIEYFILDAYVAKNSRDRLEKAKDRLVNRWNKRK